MYQPGQINTKASSPHHNPTRQILLRSLFYTKGNRSSERRCPRDLVCDKSRSGAFNPASRSLSYTAGPAPQPGRTREPDKAHFCLIHLLTFHFLHSAWQGHSNGFKNNHKKPLIWSFPTLSSWKNTCPHHEVFNQTFNGRKDVLISQGPSCTCEWLINAADNDDTSPWQPLKGEVSLVFASLLISQETVQHTLLIRNKARGYSLTSIFKTRG